VAEVVPKAPALDRRRGRVESSMPLYHFDLVNPKTHLDAGDVDLPDDIEAMDCADSIARRVLTVRPEVKNHLYSILVTNEEGEEICRLPIDIIH
jgi:hypothetical protein